MRASKRFYACFCRLKWRKAMALNILIGIMCVIAVAAGIWGWWLDNGGSFGSGKEKDTAGNIKEEVHDEKK